MVKRSLIIGHIYPKQMNVYGDMGNVITLKYRLEKRGYSVEYKAIDSFGQLQKQPVDILLGGGGQDSNQSLIQEDLLRHKKFIHSLCASGVTGLMVCGMYQMMARRFITSSGDIIEGVGIIDGETKAGDKRLIGNITVDTEYGQVIGFENHSGRTYLSSDTEPLGRVISGSGNNDEDQTEGAVVNNIFSTYLHGPVLAKNPTLADQLLIRAIEQKYGPTTLEPLDDTIENAAHKYAARRPR